MEKTDVTWQPKKESQKIGSRQPTDHYGTNSRLINIQLGIDLNETHHRDSEF